MNDSFYAFLLGGIFGGAIVGGYLAKKLEALQNQFNQLEQAYRHLLAWTDEQPEPAPKPPQPEPPTPEWLPNMSLRQLPILLQNGACDSSWVREQEGKLKGERRN